MLFEDRLVVLRGGGDLATGAVHQLRAAGFPVIVLELEHPLAIRRTVAVSSAVVAGSVTVDGVAADTFPDASSSYGHRHCQRLACRQFRGLGARARAA